MAVCNLFNAFNKQAGNFLLFSQYTEDLTRGHTAESCNATPSSFILMDVDYSKIDSHGKDLNEYIPEYMQCAYENACAYIRGNKDYIWKPYHAKNLFWKALKDLGVVTIEDGVAKEMRYIGNINMSTYDNHAGMGYSEVFCHVPAESPEYKIHVTETESNLILSNPNTTLEGYDIINDFTKQYYPEYVLDINNKEEQTSKEYTFNTVVVLYDVKYEDGTIYSDIPMGMYFTGLFDGTMLPSVTKYVSSDDAFGTGCSYGLRICTRFVSSSTTDIEVNVEEDSMGSYESYCGVMSAAAENLEQMRQACNTAVSQIDAVREVSAKLSTNKTNVPYIKEINGVPYWFVNGMFVTRAIPDIKEYIDSDITTVISKIEDPNWKGVKCLLLGGSIDPEYFNEIVNILQDILENKNHYVISIFDTVDGTFFGDCENIYKSGNVISIEQIKMSASSIIYKILYNFNIESNRYSRTVTSIDIQNKLTASGNITVEGNTISTLTMTNTTWSELKTLRDTGRLVPGTWYRITDYEAIISPEVAEISSQPNGSLYDILVIAVSPDELSEEARAIHHINDDGTIVLESSKIESWKVWYCIDNDANRFSWAYSGGKGVVYRLIDEFNNDCPYDFKEILFKRYKITECANCPTLIGKYTSREDSKYVIDKSQYIWAYTFTYLNTDSKVLDHSIVGSTMPNKEGKYTGVYNNKILPISSYLGIYPDNSTQFQYCLNNICFISDGVISNSLSYGCHSNTFGSNCYSMTFGTSCHSNTFGENCYENVFGNSIKYQSVGKNCHNNIFGDGHNHNELGNACSGNTFGTNYVYNTIGYNCYNNVFGNNYSHNSFGNSNYGFNLGNNLQSNVFLNYCSNIVFGSDSSATEKYSYYKNNFFGNNCKYILFKETESSESQYIQNYSFAQGTYGDSNTYLEIEGVRNQKWETKVAKNSSGTLKIYCEADLIP